MRLDAEMPLVPFLGLVYLGVTLVVLVLGRTGRGYQGGVHHSALFEHQAFVSQHGVDHGHYLWGMLMFF